MSTYKPLAARLEELVTDQARAELGTDKSDEAVNAYVNGMSNIEFLRLITQAIECEEALFASILREVME